MSVRRRHPDLPAIPERFARFAGCEWPVFAVDSAHVCVGLSVEEAVEFSHEARSAWALANEYEFPPGSGYLTSPIGDWLDRARAKREARMLACYGGDP